MIRHYPKLGFTLIELSIVLVIIGLIVGGILVGQDLISAAGARAQVSQIERYNAATNTFKGKYGYLPGDIPDPYATKFGFAVRGVTAGEGDGNGLIEGVWDPAAPGSNWGECSETGEVPTFWADLATARLIEGQYQGTPAVSPPATFDPNFLYPHAQIGNGNFVYVWSDNYATAHGVAINPNVNFFGIAVVSPSFCPYTTTPGLTVTQAYNIDKKVDDGLPQTGRATAIYITGAIVSAPDPATYAAGGGVAGANPGTAAAGSATTCYDNGGSATAAMHYSTEQNKGAGLNCALSFQMQGAAR